MADVDLEDEEEGDDVPIFTPELAKLRARERGEDVSDEDMQDDEEEEEEEEVKGTKKKGQYPDAFSDSEEEKEDYTIRKSDSIIVTATAENDHSNLEVYIYEHETANLYVHHEIILSSYPLCIEWLPVWQGKKSNLMIVGTF